MMVKPFAVFLLGKATSLCLNIIRPEPLLLIQNVLFRSRVPRSLSWFFVLQPQEVSYPSDTLYHQILMGASGETV